MHALVHSGGGSNGAWGVGVLKFLVHDLGFEFDDITGTSVRALNGAGLAMYPKGQAKGGIDNLLDIWSEVTPKRMYKRWWPGWYIGDLLGVFWHSGVWSTKPLKKFVQRKLDTDMLKASDRHLSVTAFNIELARLEYFEGDDDNILDGILASSSYPLFFPPVKIGEYLYSDGGLVEIVPVQNAIDRGAKVIDVIICNPAFEGPWNAQSQSTFRLMNRFLGIMSSEIALNDTRRSYALASKLLDVEIRIWQPPKGLGSGLDFEQEKVQALIQKGYEYARERAESFNLQK